MNKPIKVKPVFYSNVYLELQKIAIGNGYNLLMNGSLSRDLDLVLIPWDELKCTVSELMEKFALYLGASVMPQTRQQEQCFPHGRESRVINLNRGNKFNHYRDEQYYLDISVFPFSDGC